MVTVTLGGDLEGFDVEEPAASVRLLLPSPGSRELVYPAWTGNEFVLPSGERPLIRTLTPRRIDHDERQLDVQIVLHGRGAAPMWADQAHPGDEAAVSGPGRGYEIDRGARAFFLTGDETAIPAIGQLLEVLPADRPVSVHIEVARPDARQQLPAHAHSEVHWHDLPPGGLPGAAIVEAVEEADLSPDSRIWVAGEAAAMQRARKVLFVERGLPRNTAAVRGYWKYGRAGSPESDP
jgi:NADPH-dependent ferric siderophore reductase